MTGEVKKSRKGRVSNGKANPKFVVGDRRQVGNPGKQASNAGQGTGRVGNAQAGRKPTLECCHLVEARTCTKPGIAC